MALPAIGAIDLLGAGVADWLGLLEAIGLAEVLGFATADLVADGTEVATVGAADGRTATGAELLLGIILLSWFKFPDFHNQKPPPPNSSSRGINGILAQPQPLGSDLLEAMKLEIWGRWFWIQVNRTTLRIAKHQECLIP